MGVDASRDDTDGASDTPPAGPVAVRPTPTVRTESGGWVDGSDDGSAAPAAAVAGRSCGHAAGVAVPVLDGAGASRLGACTHGQPPDPPSTALSDALTIRWYSVTSRPASSMRHGADQSSWRAAW